MTKLQTYLTLPSYLISSKTVGRSRQIFVAFSVVHSSIVYFAIIRSNFTDLLKDREYMNFTMVKGRPTPISQS